MSKLEELEDLIDDLEPNIEDEGLEDYKLFRVLRKIHEILVDLKETGTFK